MTTFNSCAALEPTNSKPPEDDNRVLKIKRLRAKLINEEHRLVLMKKIRQSQTRPIAQQAPNQQPGNHLNLAGQQIKKLRQAQQSGQPLSLSKNSSGPMVINQIPASLNQTPAHAHQRPKVNNLWNPPQQARHPTPVGIAPPHVGNLSRQPITTPPNVVQAVMGGLTGPQSLLMNQMNAAAAAAAAAAGRRPQQPQQSHHQSSPSFSKSQAAQMLMQKRPNFKSSNQKQLEQTLMQQQQKHGGQSSLGFSSNLNKRAVGISSPHVGNISRQPITTPPNVVQDMRGSLTGQQSLLMNSNSLTNSASRRNQQQSLATQQQSPYNKSQAAQMLLQKRTAAKLAIQKQLEQTIMQLPQKQIQLGIDFIPNANNIEFVYYIGLETCVDYLTDTENPLDVKPLEKPFECSTCGTDFTPSWSWKRSNAVCENCVSNHVKKSIKNSQANRIKSILAKAAKQEHEMDQRIMAEAANVVSTPSPTSSSSQQHSLLQPASHTSRSSSQNWPRVNNSPSNSVSNIRTPTSSVPSSMPLQTPNISPAVNANPLAALQPAALASLLQMNPQLGTLASLITANNSNSNNNFAQVASLLMNQLAMNLWKR